MTKEQITKEIRNACLKAMEAGEAHAEKVDNPNAKYPFAFGYLQASLEVIIAKL